MNNALYRKRLLSFLLVGALLSTSLISCASPAKTVGATENPSEKAEKAAFTGEPFGKLKDGRDARIFTLTNKHNAKATITNYGGRLVSLQVPNKQGGFTDVVLGMNSVEAYAAPTGTFFGATLGRFGNRIAKGKFTLEGQEYNLTINNGPNTLHGGKKGFHKVMWEAHQPNAQTLELTYFSKHLDEGFPGNMKAKVTYTLTDQNELRWDYEATTDKTTVVNLTNHTYFNLNGEGSGDILGHVLHVNADAYTPVDATLIPTGEIAPVAGTPFDFRKPTALKELINIPDQQLTYGKGYDHNFVLNPKKGKGFNKAATMIGDKSGVVMEIFTVEPGLQFYSGNFNQGKATLKNGTKDEYRSAFCLETQHFPDSPNHPHFPSTVLKPGETYRSSSVYKFTVQK